MMQALLPTWNKILYTAKSAQFQLFFLKLALKE